MNKPFLSFKSLRIAIVYTIIFVLAGMIGNSWMTRNQASGLTPVINAQDLNGNLYTLDFQSSKPEARQGEPQENTRPRLLYFFADWCPVCKLQNPVIATLSQKYEVLGVAMQSADNELLQKYASQQGLEFTIINDRSGSISHAFGVNGVPAVFVIDPDGQIDYSTRGYATGAGLRSRLWMATQG